MTSQAARGVRGRRPAAKSSSRSRPKSPASVVVGTGVEQDGRPAQGGGRVADGGEGVPDIVLAVAEGTFAVLPGLAPVDRGQADQQPPGGPLVPDGGRNRSPALERMRIGGVMEHAGLPREVGLGGVQVAAGGVHPKRPPGATIDFQAEQPERAAEELADRARSQGRGRLAPACTARRSHAPPATASRGNSSTGAPRVAAERIRLALPVEIPGRPGKAVEVVLRGLVILATRASARADASSGVSAALPAGAGYFTDKAFSRLSISLRAWENCCPPHFVKW